MGIFSYQYPIADETTSAISPKEQEFGAQIASLSLLNNCKSSGGRACHDDPNFNLIVVCQSYHNDIILTPFSSFTICKPIGK